MSAQATATAPVEFEYLSVKQGLSHNRVVCTAQDQIGYLWFGTSDGLNRYDGYRFQTYRHKDKDPNSLASSTVMAVCVDRAGYLWVGTVGGLDRLDPKTGALTHYRHIPDRPDSIGDNRIRVLRLDHTGALWVGTEKSLERLDPTTGTFTHYPCGVPSSTSLGPKGVTSILEDRQGILWLGMQNDGGLTRFDPQTGLFTHYRHDPKVGNSLANDKVRSIYEDRAGALWVGTLDAGLDQLDRETGKFTHFWKPAEDPTGLPAEGVMSISEVRQELLIGTTDRGLYSFNYATRRFAPYHNNSFLSTQQPTQYILSIFEDRQNILWVGSTNGIYANGRDQKRFQKRFQTYKAYKDKFYKSSDSNDAGGDASKAELSNNNMVWGVCEDHAGDFWIGMNDGLNRLDPKTQTFTRYVHSPADPFSLSDSHIRDVYEDRRGRLWVGTKHGLNVFDPVTGRFTRYFHDPQNPDTLSNGTIMQVYETLNGEFWVSTRDGGLNRFDPQTGRAVRYRHDPKDPTTISNDKVYRVYEDRFGELWVCTQRGLNRLDRRTGTFQRYMHDSNNSKSLSYDDVYSVCEDVAGTFWACTRQGLNRFDRATGDWKVFKEEFPNPVIYFALPDESGNLWLGTENGLCRFNPQAEQVQNFDIRDGLQANEFNEGAYFQSPRGNFLIGGVNGFNIFRPEDIWSDPFIPPVVITEFRLMDRVVEDFNPSQDLVLSYDQNYCAFEFAALSFIRSQDNKYEYQLEGFEKEWVSCAGRRYASYTNLPPGDYVFRVRASNYDGVWNDAATSVRIRILPPWWRTWWAYGGYGVFGVLSVSGAFGAQAWRIRLKGRLREAHLREAVAKADQRATQIEADAAKVQMQALERENLQRMESETKIRRQNEELQEANLKLKELDQIKASFAAMLVHDLKSPLAAVKATLSFLGMTDDVQDPELLALIDGSQRNVARVMDLINEMLDVFRSEMNGIRLERNPMQPELLLDVCIQSAQVVAASKNLRLTVDIAETLPLIDGDLGKLERVFSNLLSNAMKFTAGGGEITICARPMIGTGVESGINMLLVSVTDTGEGISAEDLPYIFEPYHQAKSSKSRLGVGLGLAIVRRIVAAHGGNISVRSQLGVGSCFSVTLPALTDLENDDSLALYSAAMPETAEAQIQELNRLQ